MVIGALAATAGIWAAGPAAAQEAPATLYVGTAAAPDYESPVLVVLNDGATFDSFSVTLSFDPAFAALSNADLAPDWAEKGSVDAPDAGTIHLTGAAGKCTGAANCHLATLHFRPLEAGDTEIQVTNATLTADGAFVAVAPSPGHLMTTVAPPADQPADAPAVTSPNSSDDSLFALSFVPAAVFVIAIATAAAIGAVLVIAIGRRAWRWSERRERGSMQVASPASVTPAFEGGVGDFLARVEAFGRVTGGDSRDAGTAGLAIAASVAAVDSRPALEAPANAASEGDAP
jgi:hypothetical protein